MNPIWKGIFVILQTPFDKEGQLDEESFRREIEFSIRAGAHGLVAPAVASEFYVLSDYERERIASILVQETKGRVPVIIGTTAASKEQAVIFARHAEEVGANGLMAMPPHVMKANRERIYEYYQALSRATTLPIMIQNAPPPLGSSLAPTFMTQMCGEIERVCYIKEETLPTGHYITAILKASQGAVAGVFGGASARWMLSELERGACGFMPACHFTDVYVQIWEMWQSGHSEKARNLFNKLLPLINLEAVLSVSLCKQILMRRGVFASANVRRPDGAVLDAYDLKEMEECMKEIEPYLL